jgi:hypothetical protein
LKPPLTRRTRRQSHHIGHQDLLPSLIEVLPGIQNLQQLWTGMEFLRQGRQRRLITQILQLGLFHRIFRQYTERTVQISLRDRIGSKSWSRVRIHYLPRRRPHPLFGRKIPIALESGNSLFKIGAIFAIDLAAGKMRAVEQDLRAHHRRALRVRANRLVKLGVIDDVRLWCFLPIV